MKAIGLLLGIPFILFLGSLLRGWVLEKLWRWFVVPPFDLPALSVVQCIGLAMIVSYLTHQNIHTEDRRTAKDKFWESLGAVLLTPFFVLAMAAIVRAFI